MKKELYKRINENLVKKEISKLKPINLNRFYWWRKFDKKNKSLPPNSLLLHKIQNGDYDFSQYYWQAYFCEMKINEKYEQYEGDIQKLIENDSIDFARRKRLWEDFEKDERNLLNELKKQFINEFTITPEQYEEEIESFNGTLEELYFYFVKKYEINKSPKGKRGRPKKV
jgi:hypothetical protein